MRSDAELLDDFVEKRDEAAFTEIVRRHGAMVYRAAMRALRDRAAAEDAAQETFFVLAEKAPRFARSAALAGWLFGVARRTALKSLGRSQRRAVLEATMRATRPTTDGESPSEGFSIELDAALAALPEKLRQAVVLRHLEGRSQEESAQIAGCPQGTIAWRTAKGLDRLRRRLERSYGIGVDRIAEVFEAKDQSDGADGFLERWERANKPTARWTHRPRTLVDHLLRIGILGRVAILGFVLAAATAAWALSASDTSAFDSRWVLPFEGEIDDLVPVDAAPSDLGPFASIVFEGLRSRADSATPRAGSTLRAASDGVVKWAAPLDPIDDRSAWTMIITEHARRTGSRRSETVCLTILFAGSIESTIVAERNIARGETLGRVEAIPGNSETGLIWLSIDDGAYRRLSMSLELRARAEAAKIAREADLVPIDSADVSFVDADDFALEAQVEGRGILTVSLLSSFSGEGPTPPPIAAWCLERPSVIPSLRSSERLKTFLSTRTHR